MIKKEVPAPLPAPFGVVQEVVTPWGTVEAATVVTSRTFGTEKERYATISGPKTNPYVRFSAFRVR